MRHTLQAIWMALLWATAAAADPVEPMQVALTNVTDVGSIEFATTATYYQGDTVSLSNSVMYTGSDTNSPVQNLADCTITVRAGSQTDTGLVTTVSGYIVDAETGLYGAEFTVPATDPCYIEVTVSNVYARTYQQQKFKTRKHLGD